jgi:hypothetical protein
MAAAWGAQVSHKVRESEATVNTRNLLIASLIGGAVSLILTNVPILNLVSCLLCAGFWAGPLLAVWIYKRQTGSLTLGQGVAIGALAGVWSGAIGLLLSLVNVAGIQAVIDSLAVLAPEGTDLGEPLGAVESTLLNLGGVAFEITIGAIGGLIGGALFRSKPVSVPPVV